jgi:hypothetical protein
MLMIFDKNLVKLNIVRLFEKKALNLRIKVVYNRSKHPECIANDHTMRQCYIYGEAKLTCSSSI